MASEAHIRKVVLDTIGSIAPEADLAHLDPADRLRHQFDFDSVDFMNFAVALQERLEVAIPETDYLQLATLNSCVAYLKSKLAP
jgi:acyl carrier protein